MSMKIEIRTARTVTECPVRYMIYDMMDYINVRPKADE